LKNSIHTVVAENSLYLEPETVFCWFVFSFCFFFFVLLSFVVIIIITIYILKIGGATKIGSVKVADLVGVKEYEI
jgi:energy-coupling factor transporter transmembrane protein EcfT